LTIEQCEGCDQLFSVTLTKVDKSVEFEYHCAVDCCVIIDKVKLERCILNNKNTKKKFEKKESE
jgi:hypothetical protein